MRRVWILGASGSGKSTLARGLSEKLDANCVDLDEFYWRANWQGAPENEFIASVERALSGPTWVVAGNYTRIQARFVPLADTVIWLDYPLAVVLWRQVRRTLRRMWTQEPCCNGNFETLSRTLSRDSVQLWLWRTFNRRRRSGWNFKRRARLSGTRFVHFRHPAQCGKWLEAMRQTERAR